MTVHQMWTSTSKTQDIMVCNRKMKRRCSRLLLSSLVCYMAGRGKMIPPSIYTDAYVIPTTLPTQNHKRRSRLTQLNSSSSAPIVNGLVAQEHSHSTSLFNVGYDAKSIINFYDQRPWEVGLRLNMLGLPLLGELE